MTAQWEWDEHGDSVYRATNGAVLAAISRVPTVQPRWSAQIGHKLIGEFHSRESARRTVEAMLR